MAPEVIWRVEPVYLDGALKTCLPSLIQVVTSLSFSVPLD